MTNLATLVKSAEAAKLLGVSVRTLLRWNDAGKIPAYRTQGQHRRFDTNVLQNFLTRNSPTQAEAIEPRDERLDATLASGVWEEQIIKLEEEENT